MIRRLFVVFFVVLVAGVAVQQWSAPSGAWSCEQAPTCRATASLELDALDLNGAWISWQSFDLSPDGSEVVVALLTSDDPFRNDDRLLIATFSTTTGDLLTTLVSEEAVEFVSAAELRYSPDGSAIAAVWYENGGRLQVFDAATGQLVSTVIETDGTASIPCDGRLGLSASNDLVQCGSALFDTSTGERAADVDDTTPLAVRVGGSSASSFDGLAADGFGQREITITDGGAPSAPSVVIEPEPFDDLDRSLLAFAGSASGEERLILLEDADAWTWPSAAPRRTHPEARVSVYSVDTGALEWSAELADRTAGVAVNDVGAVATISTDGIVTVFDLG